MKIIFLLLNIFILFSCSSWIENNENIDLKPVSEEVQIHKNNITEEVQEPLIENFKVQPINTNYYIENNTEYEQNESEIENYNNTFWDYECTDDCSWHEAGYNWADENIIDNKEDCWWNSNSFIEWCIQYVNDNY